MPRMRGPVFLPSEEDNALMRELAHKAVESWFNPDEQLFPQDVIPPFAEPTRDQALMKYGERTLPVDQPLLDDPEYVEKMRHGVLPLPESTYWRNLSKVPKYMARRLENYRKVTKGIGGGE